MRRRCRCGTPDVMRAGRPHARSATQRHERAKDADRALRSHRRRGGDAEATQRSNDLHLARSSWRGRGPSRQSVRRRAREVATRTDFLLKEVHSVPPVSSPQSSQQGSKDAALPSKIPNAPEQRRRCERHSGVHSSAGSSGANIASSMASVTPSSEAGDHCGALSLSTITARTPSRKS